MTIGEKIQYIRMFRHITRDALADMTGIGKTSIYNYETNKRDMTIDVLEKITTALEIPISLIFNSLDRDDLIFEDTVRIHYAQLDRMHPEEPEEYEIEGVTYVNNTSFSEEEYALMYKANFPRLLEWKFSKLETHYEFFNLVITWYSTINSSLNINASDIDEMSSTFARMLSLHISENVLLDMMSEFKSSDMADSALKHINAYRLTSDIKNGIPATIFDYTTED